MTCHSQAFPLGLLSALAAGLIIWPATAQESPISVTSAPVGYVATVCQGGSDTILSVPFHRPPAAAGRLDGAPADGAPGVVLTLEIDPELEEDALLDEPHYVLFGAGGGLEGEWFAVIGHDGPEITIDAELASVADAEAGDPLLVIPHWTLASLLPLGNQPTVYHSAGLLLSERASELLFFDRETEGIQLAPNRKFFLTDEGWFEAADGFPEAGDVVVLPGQMIVIRHPQGADNTLFVARQQVFTGPFVQPVRRSEGSAQDNALAAPRPVPVSLADLDLGDDVFTPSATTDPAARADELLVYDNAEAAINKQPSAIYFRTPDGWVRDADGFPAADDVQVDGAQGLVVRKAAGVDAASLRWLNTPRY